MSETPPRISSAGVQSGLNTAELMRFENEKKSAGIAFLLCWGLGIFGGHRFYLHRPHASTMLVITVVSFPLCAVLIGFASLFAVYVWMFVDLFQVSRWTKEHNTAVLARIQSGQG